MNSTNLDLSGHCRRFYSNNECNGCTKAHCHRTKRLVQKLQSLKLFFRVSSGYLLPREELKDFYTHINNNRICLNFYLFSECHERHSSGHQHIEMSTQKDKLKPEPIEAVTLGGPMVSDAYFQETMACDCKFCAKKREEFGFSNIGNVSKSNEENHEKELNSEREINSKNSIKTDKLIQRNEENTKNNDLDKDTRDRKKKKNSEERSEESREKSEDEERPQKKQKKTKKEKVERREEKEETSKKVSKKTKKIDKKERKKEDSDDDNEKIIFKTKSKKKLEEPEINNDKLKATKKKQSSSKKEDKKKSKKKKEASESSEQNSSNQPSEDEEEEVKKNESENEEEQEVCARCRQKGIICEFLPCNHRNFCMVCAEKIYREVNKKCSICLRKIELFKI